MVALFLSIPSSTHATFPGENGKIAFERSEELWTISPDGTGATNLTNTADSESDPGWSPDGMKIAFDRGEPAPCYGDISAKGRNTSTTRSRSSRRSPECPAASGTTRHGRPTASQIAFGEDDDCNFGVCGGSTPTELLRFTSSARRRPVAELVAQ